MKCDGCGNEATVSETLIRAGQRVERHLCEQCARNLGLVPGQARPTEAEGGPPQAPVAAQSCPACGLSIAGFRQNGQLGCAMCYTAFEAALSPLLQRAQEGGTHHIGKVPRRWAAAQAERARHQPVTHVVARQGSVVTVTGTPPASAPADEERQRRAAELKRALAAAIIAEQYERAAQLRDELRRLNPPTPERGETA